MAETTVKEIIKRTDKADPAPEDQAALTQYITDHGPAEIARIGRLSDHVVLAIIDSPALAAQGHLVRVAMTQRIVEMKKEFNYEGAVPLEQLLIDNILVTWLRYHMIELSYIHIQQESTARAMHLERRLTLAHRRYLRSIETLARVRKMGLPALQVNIGQNQQIITG